MLISKIGLAFINILATLLFFYIDFVNTSEENILFPTRNSASHLEVTNKAYWSKWVENEIKRFRYPPGPY